MLVSRDSQWSQYITEKTMGITRYSDCASRKHHGNVPSFVKAVRALEFRGEIRQ